MQRRTVVFRRMDDAIADVNALRGGYDPAGQWSLEQILDHLIKTMKMSLEGADWGVPWPMRPLLKWLFIKRIRTGSSDAVRSRATAPASLRPDADLNAEEKIDEFIALSERIESPDTEFIPVHPVFGRISPDDWRAMHRWHAAHHLSFLVSRTPAPDASAVSAD